MCVISAVSCEHGEIVQLLVSRNAEITLADDDGSTPTDIASDDMKTLLRSSPGSGWLLLLGEIVGWGGGGGGGGMLLLSKHGHECIY